MTSLSTAYARSPGPVRLLLLLNVAALLRSVLGHEWPEYSVVMSKTALLREGTWPATDPAASPLVTSEVVDGIIPHSH